ncbi:MAG: T9SS type A sorting domain-containing protein [Gemmatimonadota bacterium]|nr:MAG: T9SS type A sorting domain-containing protein [Gemmatimonadota bacterium]
MKRFFIPFQMVLAIVVIVTCPVRDAGATNALSVVSNTYPSGTRAIEVAVTLTNDDAVWGVQFYLRDTPDVFTGDSVLSLLEDDDFVVQGNDVGGVYRVIFLNISLNDIPSGSFQTICTVQYTVEPEFQGAVELDLSNIELINRHGQYMDVVTSKGVITIGGSTYLTEDITIGEHFPASFLLMQNAPNPFNSETSITFGLPVSTRVTLTIYNLLGQAMQTLVDSELTPGYFTIPWNVQDTPSGVYLYTMKANGFQETKRMLLLR